MELCDLSALEMSALLRQRKVSAGELLNSHLKRIEAVDGRSGALDSGELTAEDRQRVHAFITVTEERARLASCRSGPQTGCR